MEFRLDTLLENGIIDPCKVTEVVCDGSVVWKGLSDDLALLENNYTFKSFNRDIKDGFNKPEYSINVTKKVLTETVAVKSKDEMEFGVPEEHKFPLDTKDHVISAIKFFNYVKPEYEEELARNIIDKMHKYEISSEHVGEKNRLCKYIDSCTADLEEEYIVEDGHISKDMTVEEIAKKHGVSVEELEKQVKMGIEVEHEHTSDDEEAKRIALDHLFEFPDYYTRLEKMEKEGEAALENDSDEELEEALVYELLDDSDDNILEEGLRHREKKRWRIIKNTMKFVDKDSVRQAFPTLIDSSDRAIVKQLKMMLEQLPEEKKQELISLHVAKQLEAQTLGYGKGHKIAGRIVTPTAGVTTAGAGAAATYFGVKSVIDSAAATASAAASSAASSAAASGAAGAIAGPIAGAAVGLGSIIGGVLVAGIIAVGGAALTAIVTGAAVGVTKGVAKHNEHKAQRKQATMMTKEQILKELKKYASPVEKEKPVALPQAAKLALAEGVGTVAIGVGTAVGGTAGIKINKAPKARASGPIAGSKLNKPVEAATIPDDSEEKDIKNNSDENKNNKPLDEAKVPGEHKCPNCGATLDAWDGQFCDKHCQDEYYGKKEEKKEEKEPKEDKKEDSIKFNEKGQGYIDFDNVKEEWNPEDRFVQNDGDGKGDYYENDSNEKVYKSDEEKSEEELNEGTRVSRAEAEVERAYNDGEELDNTLYNAAASKYALRQLKRKNPTDKDNIKRLKSVYKDAANGGKSKVNDAEDIEYTNYLTSKKDNKK